MEKPCHFCSYCVNRVGNGMRNGVRSLRRGGAQGAGRRARVKWLSKKKIKIKRERRKDLVESKKKSKKGALRNQFRLRSEEVRVFLLLCPPWPGRYTSLSKGWPQLRRGFPTHIAVLRELT